MTDRLAPRRYPADYQERIDRMRKIIHQNLAHIEKFNGIRFVDMEVKSVMIVQSYHKDIKGYAFPMNTIWLNTDFSNEEEVIEAITNSWLSLKETDVTDFLEFLEDGKRYGWD